MTIAQFKHIKSVGRFHDSPARGDVTFRKYTLIFGENGRGKTTLCAILRSLQLQIPAIVVGRRTLGVAGPSNIVIAMDGGGTALFKNGTWSGTQPPLRIFDAHYVAENIHAGDVIGPDQRRNLCRVILGSQGVGLARQYDEIEDKIDSLNTSIRGAKGIINSHAGGTKFEQFIALAADPAIDTKIEEKTRHVEGLREIHRLRARAGVFALQLPLLPTQLEATLAKTVEDVSRDAEKTVRAHLSTHGMSEDGEDWIAKGLPHTDNDSCPFCGQGLDGVELVTAFKSFFSEAYKQFREELRRYRENAERLFGDDRIKLLSSAIGGNIAAAEIWSRYVRLSPPVLPGAIDVPSILADFRAEMLAVLDRKLAAPLDPLKPPPSYHAARHRFSDLLQEVEVYNRQAASAAAAIDRFKDEADPARLQVAEKELAALQLVKRRHEPAVAAACEQFVKLSRDKVELETAKKSVRAQLDTYSETVLGRYRLAVNSYLKKFTAGFHIDQVKIEYTGRVPNSTFCVVINDTAVEPGNADTPIDQPSFRNTLSAGDRSTLALAFFLAELAEDPDKADCVVVFDDPFNSQDQFRRTCTIGEIRRCGDGVAQIIVMSHDRHSTKSLPR